MWDIAMSLLFPDKIYSLGGAEETSMAVTGSCLLRVLQHTQPQENKWEHSLGQGLAGQQAHVGFGPSQCLWLLPAFTDADKVTALAPAATTAHTAQARLCGGDKMAWAGYFPLIDIKQNHPHGFCSFSPAQGSCRLAHHSLALLQMKQRCQPQHWGLIDFVVAPRLGTSKATPVQGRNAQPLPGLMDTLGNKKSQLKPG